MSNYEIKPLLEKIFLSRDFYSPASVGTQIKSPVELAISTYRKLGQKSVPGVPDFNLATGALGQQLFSPPTVAGWAGGQSWITPGLLLERGNFARDVLFPGHQLSSAGSFHRRRGNSKGRRTCPARNGYFDCHHG